MKKSSTLLIVAALMLSACGTMTQIASSGNGQQFQDGIYSNTPAFRTKAEKTESKSETQALVEKTKESPIYLFGDKKDTVMIPDNMSATIRFDQKLGGTVVTVGENPYDWRYDLENNYGYYYGPYSIGSSWYWSRHYYPWSSWAFAPWRYGGLHFSWYDPWYYSGWYDPWYYGSWYGGWYDPWYYGGYWGHYPWYPHYAGWYGGWDPYWGHGHHHHGPGFGRPEDRREIYHGVRGETESGRVFAGTSLRDGGGRTGITTRNSATSSRASTRSGRVTSSRSSAVKATPSIRGNSGTPTRVAGSTSTSTRAPGAAVNTGTTTRRPSATMSGSTAVTRPSGTASRPGVQSNHRRPAATIGGSIERNDAQSSGTQTYRGNSATATRQPSTTYERSSSTYERSSSSYNRSSSSSSRSSMSTGSSSAGRSGGDGGGVSRSGGSGGRR